MRSWVTEIVQVERRKLQVAPGEQGSNNRVEFIEGLNGAYIIQIIPTERDVVGRLAPVLFIGRRDLTAGRDHSRVQDEVAINIAQVEEILKALGRTISTETLAQVREGYFMLYEGKIHNPRFFKKGLREVMPIRIIPK